MRSWNSSCSRSVSQLTFRLTRQITLDPTSATTENFEALTPLIKTIQESESEQLYLNSLDRFVEEKEREIEQICETNYEVRNSCSDRKADWGRTLFPPFSRCRQ